MFNFHKQNSSQALREARNKNPSCFSALLSNKDKSEHSVDEQHSRRGVPSKMVDSMRQPNYTPVQQFQSEEYSQMRNTNPNMNVGQPSQPSQPSQNRSLDGLDPAIFMNRFDALLQEETAQVNARKKGLTKQIKDITAKLVSLEQFVEQCLQTITSEKKKYTPEMQFNPLAKQINDILANLRATRAANANKDAIQVTGRKQGRPRMMSSDVKISEQPCEEDQQKSEVSSVSGTSSFSDFPVRVNRRGGPRSSCRAGAKITHRKY